MKPLQMARLKKTMSAALIFFMLTPLQAFAAESKVTANEVSEVLSLLEQNHVSAPSKESLTGAAIQGMVESLNDPYTVYFSKDQWQQFTNVLEQNYVGIGVRVGEDKDGILVVEVFDGTPAAEAGIKRGDIITGVEGASIVGQKLDDVIKKIMGPEGTKVSLTVQRDGSSFETQAGRRQVQVPVVTSHMFENGVGYIRVSSFSSESDELFASQMETLKKSGIQSLVIDLRDNGGGLLDSALNMAKLFIKDGTLIHTKNRDNADEPVPIKNGTTQSFPVVMLVNDGSASASEVLTGALQDYLGVKVIGTKTFGKGSVQNVFPLASGGALKVTIEEYLTPKMRKVNKVGLTPDIQAEGDVPQLVAALRAGGVGSFKLELNRRNITLNGYDLTDSFSVVRQEGRVYVPSRVLAALVGASISWNDAAQAVDIAGGGVTASYPAGSGSGDMINIGGTSYVDAGRFADSFKTFTWTQEGDKLTFSAN